MTHDELIEVVARAVEPELARQEMVLTDPISLRRMMAERIARAAIRVIAPAVLEEAAYCAAATNANCYGDPTDVYETMIDAIRAMKTRYEQ